MMKKYIVFVLTLGILLLVVSPLSLLAAPGKVVLCHKPGTPAERTIEVAETAVQAHLDHGDREGECGALLICPFDAEYSLTDPIEVFFQITSSTQDLTVLGIGSDGGEGNFNWTSKKDGTVLASGSIDDFIQLSWFVSIDPGDYSIILQASEGTAPKAESVRLTCSE